MEKLHQMSIAEFLALSRFQLARGKKRFTLYLQPTKIPPLKPFKEHRVEDSVVGVDYLVYVKPSQEGGWLIRVRVMEKPFNTLPQAILERASQQ